MFPCTTANPFLPILEGGSPGASFFLSDPNYRDLNFTNEYVDIRVTDIGSMKAQLNATYRICNNGNHSITQSIAIPGNIYLSNEDLINTSFSVDGFNVQCASQKNVEIDTGLYTRHFFCFIINVSFLPWQNRTLDVNFPISLKPFFITEEMSPDANLTVYYVVTTGRSWNRPIQTASFHCSIPRSNVKSFTNITPPDASFQNDSISISLSWNYSNWWPTDEISVSWIPSGWPLRAIINQTEIQSNKRTNLTINATARFDGSWNYSTSFLYYFDFGDGTTSDWITNSSVNHSYNSYGTYNAKVWVKESYTGIITDEPGIITINIQNEILPQDSSIYYLIVSIVATCFVICIIIYFIAKHKMRKVK